MNKYTVKENELFNQFKNGPYHTLIIELSEEEHLKFIKKLIDENNINFIIFLTCIYINYNNKFLIDYFINRKNVDDLLIF